METYSKEFRFLFEHYQNIANTHMRDLFADDHARFKNFSLDNAGLFLDYSKNRITQETMKLLLNLAESVHLDKKIEDLFTGMAINTTENRAALHVALRDLDSNLSYIGNEKISQQVQATLLKMQNIVKALHEKKHLGFGHKPIQDIVNIGIGGSDLGPAMATKALSPFAKSELCCHFVSNVDGGHIGEVIQKLNPETTLFIIASKSFTTQETLCNANTAKKWLHTASQDLTKTMQKHFIAVTAFPDRASEFGIDSSNILPMWDWVGGRFSLWSAIGLTIAISIGMDNFTAFLNGAHAMDQHFRNTNFDNNMPVILALLGIWYINFFNIKSYAILPYSQNLELLPAYLQQAEMESNGKHRRHTGAEVNFSTSPVIWGTTGCNGQHAFHQLLHQGTHLIPIDFILPMQSAYPFPEHHTLLVANCLSQSKALMQGKTADEIQGELINQGFSMAEIKRLLPHKLLHGNRPSNTIVMPKLTPHTLGALLALYEHKIFVQGVIWGINSFDQWGVESSKQFTAEILQDLLITASTNHDCSTSGLINYYKDKRN